jgi:serine protease Do
MGNPFGNVIDNPTPTVTAGVISALKRNFRPSENIPRVYLDMIQTDAAINPGNSGGALINAAGELIGINTFIVSRSGGAEGIGFAIPINRVKSVIKEIVDHGKIRARLVDFQTTNLNNRMVKMLNTNAESGAVVSRVNEEGPAREAGLQVGDVITHVNGEKVRDAQDLKLKVWYNRQVGSRFQFSVDRSGDPVTVQYTLVEPPEGMEEE